MADITQALVVTVEARMDALAARIPPAAAVIFGRAGAPPEADLASPFRQVRASLALTRDHAPHGVPDPPALLALRYLAMPTERLLGALELTLAGWDPVVVPEVAALVASPPAGDGLTAILTVGSESTAVNSADLLRHLHPGVVETTEALARRLAAHPSIRARLDAAAGGSADESVLAARQGIAGLALSVATASVVVDQLALPSPHADRATATVGLGVGVAAQLLQETPLSPAYTAALWTKLRAEYQPPSQLYGTVTVSGHRFGLLEDGAPTDAGPTRNGLTTPVDGGVMIRTGVADGSVRVELAVLETEPPEIDRDWEEVVDVSWHATVGWASVLGPDDPNGDPTLRHRTPPWPGDYRVRVHARGRDENDAEYERYRLVVWPAPPAPETVHRGTDRLGHRLRGESEPAPTARPEVAYRWIRRTGLADAATITVVTGATVDDVLRAFGADPGRAEPSTELRYATAWVAVLDLGDAVLAVEDNGFRGAQEPTLRAVSTQGRAASMYWSVEADTRLSFAEHGQVLASFEPWGKIEAEPPVASALHGLDLEDVVDRIEKGLVAVERFTGRAVTAADLTRLESTAVGYRTP